MAPRRNNSRLGHTRSVSCANENVPIHSLIGPQRSKPVLLNKSNRSGLPSSSNLSNSSNLKDSSHKHSSSLGNPNLSTRRVLGDVSNAIKVLGSSKPSIGSDLKTSIQAKPSKVRKVASQTSLDQSKPIGISSTISKGLNLGNSATFGGNAGKKLVESLKSRASASTLKNTSCSDSSSSSITSKRKSIQKSISESGSILTWSNLDSNLIPQDDQNQFEILNDHQINSQNLDHLIHLEIPSNQIINHHHHHHHDMIIDEEHLNTNHHHSNHQSLDQVKINLPDTVFAQAEAENLANQSDHEDDDHQIGQSSTNQLYDSIPTYHSIDSDENELSLCRNHLEDQEINQSLDHDNWLLLLPDEEIESKRIIEAIKKEFQEELDYWDATMVAEYSEEIFKYMQELEESTLPNPRYMESQTEIEWDMRTTLIDWLLQVHMRYHMLPETLWIAVNIIDRFLSKRVVSLVKFQLVGVTAMFVAAKYEEIMAPSVEEFVYMTENGYTRDEILKGEKILLTTLDFKISSYCSPYSWLRRISKADDYDIQTRTLSKFLMELTLLDYRFLRAKSSMIAAIGMFTARKMLGGDWSDAFVYYSGYTETQLITPMSFLIEFLSTDGFEDRFVYKKYANRKFLKASIFARNQALKRTRQDESQNSDF